VINVKDEIKINKETQKVIDRACNQVVI